MSPISTTINEIHTERQVSFYLRMHMWCVCMCGCVYEIQKKCYVAEATKLQLITLHFANDLIRKVLMWISMVR